MINQHLENELQRRDNRARNGCGAVAAVALLIVGLSAAVIVLAALAASGSS